MVKIKLNLRKVANIIACLAVLTANNILAQDSQENVTFKGVPLIGTISSFAQELEKQGCTIKETKGNVVILKGEFVSRECEIYVFGSKKTNTVWKVVAYLPEAKSWYSLKSEYLKLKTQFQQKYGKGKSYEFFSNPYYEGDGYEIQALRKEKCTYTTFFDTERGPIAVEISKYEQIKIAYEDAINTKSHEQEEKDIINNDI